MWFRNRPEGRTLERSGQVFFAVLLITLLAAWNSGVSLYYLLFGGMASFVMVSFFLARGGIARLRVVESRDGLPSHDLWLLLRRSLTDGQVKYAFSNAPVDIALREMIRVSGLRWPIEQCFQEGKSEIGMDHYEHRSWDAWHRHMTFVFLAQLFLMRVRHLLKKKPRP